MASRRQAAEEEIDASIGALALQAIERQAWAQKLSHYHDILNHLIIRMMFSLNFRLRVDRR